MIVTWHYEPFDGVRWAVAPTPELADKFACALARYALLQGLEVTICIREMDTVAAAIKSALG